MKRFLLCSVLGLVGVATLLVDASGGPFRGGRGGRLAGRRFSSRHAFHGGHSFSPAASGYSVSGAPAATASETEEEPAEVLQTRRYLSVKNDTEEPVTVYVRYRTFTSKDDWRWFPAATADSEEALAYELEPGEEVSLEHDGWAVNASRVRIWAVSKGESGNEWLDNKDKDLWLVPEVLDGCHSYSAVEMETYTFTIAS